MDTQNVLNQVNKLTALLADANLLASELEGIVTRQLEAEMEAIEAQGRALEARQCAGGCWDNNGDECKHPDHPRS